MISAKAPKKPTKPKDVKRAAATRRDAAIDKLAAELAGLRTGFEESIAQFEIKVQGQLAECQARVSGENSGADPLPPLGLAAVERALGIISELKIKPGKGRLKDIVRVAEVVDQLGKPLRRR